MAIYKTHKTLIQDQNYIYKNTLKYKNKLAF